MISLRADVGVALGAAAHDIRVYAGRVRQFTSVDWIVYISWVGLMMSLVLITGGFLVLGTRAGAQFPAEAWMVPVGALVFSCAIAFDTIGHRTVYKEALRGGEALVHHVTIFNGIGSCVLLVLAYSRHSLWIPAMVLTGLSFVYSLVDEVMHWRRYLSQKSDRVEMWSHVFIFIGHGTMMLGWWQWFFAGYPGVKAALVGLGVSR